MTNDPYEFCRGPLTDEQHDSIVSARRCEHFGSCGRSCTVQMIHIINEGPETVVQWFTRDSDWLVAHHESTAANQPELPPSSDSSK